jgi:riboflavin synthase
MFTGIIEELGKVVAIEAQPDAKRITFEGPLVTSDVSRGDSIAVCGACLTAVELEDGRFTADVMNDAHEDALAAGVNDFVTKPVHLGRLQDVIRKHLEPGSETAPS